MLGAVPNELTMGQGWNGDPVAFYYNQSDPVYGANRQALGQLEQDELGWCVRKLPGSHRLQDYIANESFGGLLRRAARSHGHQSLGRFGFILDFE